MDYKDQGYKCKIPSVSVEIINGKKVAVFRVEITHLEHTEVFRKRYRDFSTFDQYLRGGFDGHHLLQNLPKLPPKRLALFTDHFSKEFLNERRRHLEEYVNKLCRIPKAVGNPDFIAFFTKKKKKKKKKVEKQERDIQNVENKRRERESSKARTGIRRQDARSHNLHVNQTPNGEGAVEVIFDK